MFGLFRKKAEPSEFGHAALHLATDFLSVDSGRSLGMRFDNFDASNGWLNFLERKSVSKETQIHYYRLFCHSSMQAACIQFDKRTRRDMTYGAMGSFANKIDGYDIEITFSALEDVYSGKHKFQEEVAGLKNLKAQLTFLPKPSVGVLNAKFLIENFIFSHLQNSGAFIRDFEEYSGTVCVGVATIQRAFDHLFRSFKLD